MKCSRCGADIEEGKLFCSRCGQEVQLVPNYDTLGSRLFEEQPEKKVEEEHADSPEGEAGNVPKKHKVRPIAVGIALLLACMAVLLAVKAYMDHRNYNSFDYQIERAESAYSNKSYEEALDFANRAAALEPDSLKASLLRARIYTGLGKLDEAEKELLAVIEKDPENKDGYGQLLELYESEKETDKIKDLMDNCTSDSIRKKYAEYICEPVTFGMEGGEYYQIFSLRLSAEEGSTIYYTTDGSTATEDSTIYGGPIRLSEGTTVVSALAVNSKGIKSDLTVNTYTITLKAPTPPQIALGSGTYTDDMDTTIYVFVQENCKAYYAFDEMPTTDSKLYTSEGIAMPEGKHTLYVISVNQYGKASAVSSETYTLQSANPKTTPTPTPTPTPESTPTPTPTPTTTPEAGE